MKPPVLTTAKLLLVSSFASLALSKPRAYIIELQDRTNIAAFSHAVQVDSHARVRREFDYTHFKGISVEFESEDELDNLRSEHRVKKVWPVELLEIGDKGSRPNPMPSDQDPLSNALKSAYDPYVETQIHRLRSEGLTGKGIKVAIIDTGVDYKHPALGGCFGPGCLISFGADLLNNELTPRDCQGHGTLVAGIVAAQTNPLGFIGAAPGVELGMYRATCDGVVASDVFIDGIYRAVDDGARIILSAAGVPGGWTTSLVAQAASRAVAEGVVFVQAMGNDGDKGPFSLYDPATGSGVLSVGSSNGAANRAAEAISQWSSWGPSWDLALKPSLLAPGSRLVSTAPRDMYDIGYQSGEGTSISAPLVAGIAALILESRPSLDPSALHSLLVSSAIPQFSHDRQAPSPYLASAAQQGGGIVRAYDAALSTTIVQPVGLSFNDSEHAVGTSDLTLRNIGDGPITYQLSHVSALTTCILSSDGSRASGHGVADMVMAAAVIKLSQDTLTLAPGQSQAISVTATEPGGMDSRRLALWSGWISVNGSDGSLLSIPYQGLAGSIRNQRVLQPDAATLYSWDVSVANRPDIQLPAPGSDEPLNIFLMVNTTLGTPLLRADLVPISHNSVADSMMGNHLFGFADWLPAGVNYVPWICKFNEADFPAEGSYKIVVQALRIFGDPDNENDWDVSETLPFNITFERSGSGG